MKEKKKLILMRGIPGSGKTTWAKKWVSEDSKHRIRISWDDLRRMFGNYWVPQREDFIKAVSRNMLYQAAFRGYDIVIDNMNLSEESKELFIYFAQNYFYEIEYKDFKTPLEECISRDSLRKGDEHIGEDIIKDIYNKNLWFYE